MTKPVRIDEWFDFSNAVPVTDSNKQKWIEEAIKYLKDHPDEFITYIASGDTLILVSKDEGTDTYNVKDLKVRKEASFTFPKKAGNCVCEMQVVISQGCQCGGK